VRFPAGNLLVPGILFIVFQSSTPPLVVTPDQALDRICDLPEVRDLADRVERVSGGAVHATVYPDGPSTGHFLDFSVGESHEDHNVRWATIAIDASTGRLYAWDYGLDGYVDYEQWRKQLSR
jgi:hypothetical protein